MELYKTNAREKLARVYPDTAKESWFV